MVWLSGYTYRKTINYAAAEGAGGNYQILIKCYYGTGTDGTEAVNGETIPKLYLAGKCNTDFSDVHFTLADSDTEYTYRLISKTDSNNALFIVKVTADMDTARAIDVYYGNAGASSASSDAALIGIIDDVVLALPMDEAAGNCTDYSGNSNTGVNTNTTVTTSPFFAGQNARVFDTTAYLTCGTDASLNVTSAASLIAYVKNASATAQMIATKTTDGTTGYALYFRASNPYLRFRIENSGGDKDSNVATQYQDDSEHVIVATFNGTVMKVYVDGTEEGTTDFTGSITSHTAGSMLIGDSTTYTAQKYNGIMAGFYKTSSAISPTDAALFNAGVYSDAKLIEGKLCLRKWASTTVPVVSSIDAQETIGDSSYYYYYY